MKLSGVIGKVAVFCALFCAAATALCGEAVVLVVNDGDRVLLVEDCEIPPRASARVMVPSDREGRLDVSVPSGWTLSREPKYPPIPSGAIHQLRLRLMETPGSPEPPPQPRRPKAPGPGGSAPPASRPAQPAAKAPGTDDAAPPASRPAQSAAQVPQPPAAASASRPAQPAAHVSKPPVPASGGTAVEFSFPVLSVVKYGTETVGGKCERRSFSLRRDKTSAPLRISMSEDLSGGAGLSSRAGLWQAAMTAAILRNDPLDGIKIEQEVTGFTDGPSAGGVTCLAILSALDGRLFPDDFAMTGTIMADGTIGLVGGVALKLEGAKEAGIKRVCIPAFERLEVQDDGSYVDLHDKARELGLELHPVRNIAEAYAVAHHLPLVYFIPLTDSEVYADTPAVEEAIVDFVGDSASDSRIANDAVKKAVEEDRDDAADSAYDAMNDNRNLPSLDVALKGGMYHVCVELAASKNAFWRGQIALKRRIIEIERRHPGDSAAAYRSWFNDNVEEKDKAEGRIGRLEREWFDSAGARGPLSPLAAQCVAVNLGAEMINIVERTGVPVVEDGVGEEVEERKARASAKLLRREAIIAWYVAYAERLNEGWRKVAEAMPPMSPKGNLNSIEDFFFSARVAQDKSIEQDLGKLSSRLGKNYDWTLYLLKCNEASRHHHDARNALESGGSGAAFASVVSIMSQIDAIAHGSMISKMISNEIGISLNEEGDFVMPSDKPYLGYLLRNARIEAVNALAECAEAGIPCPRCRTHIETGDYYRESRYYDVFDVLREYWCARLKAKALLMIFGKGGK